MQEIQLRLRGYSLTTAEILYHLPDHPALLQSYVWQDLDIAPKFPQPQPLPAFLAGQSRRQASFRARRSARADFILLN